MVVGTAVPHRRARLPMAGLFNAAELAARGRLQPRKVGKLGNRHDGSREVPRKARGGDAVRKWPSADIAAACVLRPLPSEERTLPRFIGS